MNKQNITVLSSGQVYLTLPDKQYKGRRCVGEIKKDTFHCERNPERHLFRQFGGSYGFNYELMRDGSFKFVIVHLPFGEQLLTTRQHILNKGKMLNFQRNQLEKQIFLPISEFGIDKAKGSEMETFRQRQVQQQPSLFAGVA